MSDTEHERAMASHTYARQVAWELCRLCAMGWIGAWGLGASWLLLGFWLVPMLWLGAAGTAPRWLRSSPRPLVPGLAFAWLSGLLVRTLGQALEPLDGVRVGYDSMGEAWVFSLTLGCGAIAGLSRLRPGGLAGLGWTAVLGAPIALGLIAAELADSFGRGANFMTLALLVAGGPLVAAYLAWRERQVRESFEPEQVTLAAATLVVAALAGAPLRLLAQPLWPKRVPAPELEVLWRRPRPAERALGAAIAALVVFGCFGARLHLHFPWPDARVERLFEPQSEPQLNLGALAVGSGATSFFLANQVLYRLDDGGLRSLAAEQQAQAAAKEPTIDKIRALAPAGAGAVYLAGAAYREDGSRLELREPTGRYRVLPRLAAGVRQYEIVGLAGDDTGAVWVREREARELFPARYRWPGEGTVDRLVRQAPDGERQLVAAGPERFGGGEGLVRTPAGTTLLVCEGGVALIEVRDDGSQRRIPLAGLVPGEGVKWLGLDRAGRLFGASEHMLYALAPAGTCTWLNHEAIAEYEDPQAASLAGQYRDTTGDFAAHGDEERRYGPGGLRGSCFRSIGGIALDMQGRLLVADYGLRRVSWRGRAPGAPWGAGPPLAWVPNPPLRPERVTPAGPELIVHLPPPVAGRLPLVGELVPGEDVFTTAARLRRSFKVTQRDKDFVPTDFRGAWLGHAGVVGQLKWSGDPHPKPSAEADARWPTRELRLFVPAGRTPIAPLWRELYAKLAPHYGPGSRFTLASSRYRQELTTHLAEAARLEPATARDIEQGYLQATMTWPRAGSPQATLQLRTLWRRPADPDPSGVELIWSTGGMQDRAENAIASGLLTGQAGHLVAPCKRAGSASTCRVEWCTWGGGPRSSSGPGG